MESTSISLNTRSHSVRLAEFRPVHSRVKSCFKLPRHVEDRMYHNNIVLPSQTKWAPSPTQETSTLTDASSIAEVPRTESIRAVVVDLMTRTQLHYPTINLPCRSLLSLSIPMSTRRKPSSS